MAKQKINTSSSRSKSLKQSYVDLTKTGALSYRELQSLMGDNREYIPSNPIVAVNQHTPILDNLIREDHSVQYNLNTDYGNSMFDPEGYATESQIADLGNIRAENQPWYAKIGAGITKGAVLVGTTFLDGTVGLLTGIGTAAAEKRFSGVWDNPFSNAMSQIEEWSEKAMPNYYSSKELEGPWYENIFTANFIGDKFIKNLGFSIGALYSGGVYTAPFKAAKVARLINGIAKSTKATSNVASVVGSFMGAVNEGRVEARHNSKEWFDLQKQMLDDAYSDKVNRSLQPLAEKAFAEYQATGDMEKYEETMALIQQRGESLMRAKNSNITYNEKLKELTENRLKMGNMDMIMNIPILTMSNFVQFGKFFARGFKTAKKTAQTTGRNIVGTATEIGQNAPYKVGTSKWKTAFAATKGALSEGTEEIAQKMASVASGKFYDIDPTNFNKAKKDRNAEEAVTDWIKAVGSAVNETVNDGSSWEEFFIGSLTGLLGIPTFRSAKSSEGKFQSPVTLAGGVWEHMREYRDSKQRDQEVVDYMNNRVQSPEFLNYYQGLIRHQKYQKDMNDAVINDSEFDYKNAEHAQLVSDIAMFGKAGKLEDLKALIGTAYDMSDENLNSIITTTTSIAEDGTLAGPFAEFATKNEDGTIEANFGSEESKKKMVDILTKSKDEMMSAIDSYAKIKDDIEIKYGQHLNDDQIEELTWMRSQIDNWKERGDVISGEVQEALKSLISAFNDNIDFYTGIRTEEGMRSADLTDTYKRADKGISDSKEAIKVLEKAIASKGYLGSWLSSKKASDGLIKTVESVDDSIMPRDKKDEIIQKVKDLSKIENAKSLYSNKLAEYLLNPQKQLEDHAVADQAITEEARRVATQSLREKLAGAKGISEFGEILDEADDDSIREGVIADMINEGSKVAKNYKEVSQYSKDVEQALAELGEDEQTTQDALTLWNDQREIAENVDQIANPSTVAINNSQAFAEGTTPEEASSRFENARYALQRAMTKVNNDKRFEGRFAKEFRATPAKPASYKVPKKETTGDSGTPTVPPVNSDRKAAKVRETPTGDRTAKEIEDENKGLNDEVITQTDLDNKQEGPRRYYRPAIPEIHIEASKEGDFRPFDVVVSERESGVDFSTIYNYLRDNGAFDYVNSGKLKVGDTIRFMIDPEFEASVEGKPWHKAPTVFMVTEGGQIVGSIDEGASIAKYEGLENLVKKVRDEYQAARQTQSTVQDKSGTEKFSNFEDAALITSTSQGYKVVTTLQDWSKGSSDVRTSPEGWGTHNGLTYYKRTIGGRTNDNTTIWIKKPLTEEGRKKLEEAFNKISKVTDENKAELLKIINENQVVEGQESESTERFIASPSTRVSKMMIGKVPYTSEEKSLADIPGVVDNDGQPIFGIIKSGVLTTNDKVDDNLVVKPADMSNKEGRLYLLIPNAAGTYSPVAVRVRHFNTKEFNLNDATVANTVIGKDINTALDMLTRAENQDGVNAAVRILSDCIYMGKGDPSEREINLTWFDAKKGSGIVIGRKIRKPDGSFETVIIDGEERYKEEYTTIYFQSNKTNAAINGIGYDIEIIRKEVDKGTADPALLDLFGQPKDPADIRRDILNTLLRFNLPMQVNARKINSSDYNTRIIGSNVVTSNIREAKTVSSWFTTDYFDNQGKSQKAANPPSVPYTPPSRPSGGTVQGTRVVIGNTPYIVDLQHSIATNERTGEKRAFSAFNSKLLTDMAWAQESYGDATESSRMTDNKIVTPDGDVLDRTTGKYLIGEEAQEVKDKIAGVNKDNRIAQSKRVLAEIDENQKKVDKSRTDSDYYYVLEEDGEYHKYSRVHSRLGNNWLGDDSNKSESAKKASENGLAGGSAVDKIIRDFFTSKTPVRPDIMSEEAFNKLVSRLTEIKSNMEQHGETFLTSNIVVFHKYADGTRVAGELDILSVTKDGHFRIYDAKTSKRSFSHPFFTQKSPMQKMSTLDYYTLQLSAYQNLFESQYGVRPSKLAILPFVLEWGTETTGTQGLPSGTRKDLGQVVNAPVPYFRTDKKVDGSSRRFEYVESEGVTYFSPILDNDAFKNTLKSTDGAKNAVEFVGGEPKEATDLVLVEPGELRKNKKGRLEVVKKAKVFAVTPSTPSATSARDIVADIKSEPGIMVTYNPNVNVPVERRGVEFKPETKKESEKKESKRGEAPEKSEQRSPLPIFDSILETKNPENRVLPENAFKEGGEIGFYEKDGKLYRGYLKKVGEVEAVNGSGQKLSFPVYLTKVRDIGYGRPGEFGSSSEYITVFENGLAINVLSGNDTDDDHAAGLIMRALSAKPEKVMALSSEKTRVFNPRALEELDQRLSTIQGRVEAIQEKINTIQKAHTSTEGKAEGDTQDIGQKEMSIRKGSAKRTRHRLRAVDRTRATWDRKKELSWLAKILPQLSEQDRVKVVKGLIQVSENGPVAWGMFSNGIITLSDIAAEGTTYHEAFHVVFNLMLTPQEREVLFEEARSLYGNKSELDLEEDMAEGFREYVSSQDSRSLGRKILDFFKSLFAKITNWKYMKPSLTAYYQMINQGKYKRANLGVSNINRLRQEEYTPEMQSIKEQAIANSTFMQAPNGNPTNLNERQWLQVRTKAFKDWFGDWERVANSKLGDNIGETDIAEIINKDGSINFDKLEEITNKYFKSVDKSLFKQNRETLRERKEHHDNENNTLEHLQNVVKTASNLNIREDLKSIVVLAAALHDIAKPFHGGQKHGYQSVEVINKLFKGNISSLAKFAIRHHMLTLDESKPFTQEDANRIIQEAIDNNLNINDAIDVLLALNTADIIRGRDLSVIDKYSGKTLKETIDEEIPAKRQLLENAINNTNNVSKVVDENGEPMIVYHGTKNNEFNTFDYKNGRESSSGFFFTSDKQYAINIANKQNNNRVISAFIKLVNPVITDTPLHSNNIDEIVIFQGPLDEQGKHIYVDGVQGHDLVTREIDKSNGTEFVVFRPNNIKSATSNIGDFSTTNDDIRYRMVDLSSIEDSINREYESAKKKVRELNNRRYNTEQAARKAFKDSGINENLFYRITSNGAKNSVGYKIQLLTEEAFNDYKDSILDSMYYSEQVNDRNQKEDIYFDSIDPEVQMELLNKGWTKEKFNSISQPERDIAIECLPL